MSACAFRPAIARTMSGVWPIHRCPLQRGLCRFLVSVLSACVRVLQERDKLIALQATSAEADEKKGAKDGEAVQKISDLATSVSSLRQSVSLLTTRIEELVSIPLHFSQLCHFLLIVSCTCWPLAVLRAA
jgi:hypothetical protein